MLVKGSGLEPLRAKREARGTSGWGTTTPTRLYRYGADNRGKGAILWGGGYKGDKNVDWERQPHNSYFKNH